MGWWWGGGEWGPFCSRPLDETLEGCIYRRVYIFNAEEETLETSEARASHGASEVPALVSETGSADLVMDHSWSQSDVCKKVTESL